MMQAVNSASARVECEDAMRQDPSVCLTNTLNIPLQFGFGLGRVMASSSNARSFDRVTPAASEAAGGRNLIHWQTFTGL